MRTLWELAKQSLTPSQNEAEFKAFKSTLQHLYHPILRQQIYLRFTTILLCTQTIMNLDQMSELLTYIKLIVFALLFLSLRRPIPSFDNILLLSLGYAFLAPILSYCHQSSLIGICWLCLCLMLSDHKYFIAYFFTGGLCLGNYLWLLLFLCFQIRGEKMPMCKGMWVLLFMIIDCWKDWRTIFVIVLIDVIIATDRHFRHNKRPFSDYCEVPNIKQYY